MTREFLVKLLGNCEVSDILGWQATWEHDLLYYINIAPELTRLLLVSFALHATSQMLRNQGLQQRKFMHKAVKQGNGKQDLALLPWSQEGCSVYGMSRDEEGGPQFSSVAQSCPILCEPVNRSTPGLPVHHQLPESTQTHVNWVCDVIQPSHPLLSPSPPAATPSQHQGIFQWVNSSHEVAKVLGKGDSCRKEVRSSAQAHWVAHLCIF